MCFLRCWVAGLGERKSGVGFLEGVGKKTSLMIMIDMT